jgi:Apea-like HEPN
MAIRLSVHVGRDWIVPHRTADIERIMNEELLRACEAYFNALARRFNETRRNFDDRIFATHGPVVIRCDVEAAESAPEFRELVAQMRTAFIGIHSHELRWVSALQNLFRRSGLYQALFDQKRIAAAEVSTVVTQAFERATSTTTYLAPLELVWFFGANMNFEDFQIRRYSVGELDALLQNKTNRIFYPEAATDLNRLAQYWFLSIPVPTNTIGMIDFNYLDDIPSDPAMAQVATEYCRFPSALEFPLRAMTLFNWKPNRGTLPDIKDSVANEWQPFSIPFVLQVTDNLLDRPRTAPDLSRLDLEPCLDPQTGEERDKPRIEVYLDKDEAAAFEARLNQLCQTLREIRTNEKHWEFLERAMNYLLKAYFSDGLEQLLWHITVVEALAGENESIVQTLSRRVANALGKTVEQREDLKKKFKKLYDFRSKLVHGGELKKPALVTHLADAREIARRLMLWFLHLAEICPTEDPLTRDDFTGLLDVNTDGRKRLYKIADKLPPEFPCVEDWFW